MRLHGNIWYVASSHEFLVLLECAECWFSGLVLGAGREIRVRCQYTQSVLSIKGRGREHEQRVSITFVTSQSVRT
jgi:hypothetical protein